MKLAMRWLVGLMIPDEESLKDPHARAGVGLIEGWVSIIVNLLLAVVKLILGVMFQSAGLISDAVHSLGDMASSAVVIVGFRAARKPPDPEHPFGHEKSEQVATLIISVLLVIAGFEIGKSGLMDLLSGEQKGAEYLLTWELGLALFGLMLVKEWLALFSYVLGEAIGSKVLEADGWHHRADALTTGIVILGLAGRNFDLPWLDSAAGVGVAGFIIFTGIQSGYHAISPLLGETVDAESLETIRETACRVPPVQAVHDIRVQRYGNFFFTTLHAELSDRLEVHKMHEVTVQIETRILKKFPGECVVHVDPINLHHPLFNHVTEVLRRAVISHPQLVDFHDLKLWRDGETDRGEVEVSVDPDASDSSYEGFASTVKHEVLHHFPDLDLTVLAKVDFSATPL